MQLVLILVLKDKIIRLLITNNLRTSLRQEFNRVEYITKLSNLPRQFQEAKTKYNLY